MFSTLHSSSTRLEIKAEILKLKVQHFSSSGDIASYYIHIFTLEHITQLVTHYQLPATTKLPYSNHFPNTSTTYAHHEDAKPLVWRRFGRGSSNPQVLEVGFERHRLPPGINK